MSDTPQLAGKVAVVTGAAGAIGAAASVLMAARGASVVAVDRPGSTFDAVKAAVGDAASIEYVTADVTDEASVAGYADAAKRAFGRIDIFFNNAGVEGVVAPIPEYPTDAFQHVLAVNILGVFLGMKYVIPVMAAGGGGSIINCSSVAGLIGSPGLSAYIASKHAVIGLTRTAAIECGPLRIRVNSVNPGPIESRMMRSIEQQAPGGQPAAAHEQFTKMIPYGRYGSVDEVARLVAFLGSDESEYITGGIHTVDGGMSAG